MTTVPNDAARTVGIIGPGKVGSAIGRLALAAGHRVLFLGSERQAGLQMLLDIIIPGSTEAGSARELVEQSDMVLITVPFSKSEEIDYDAFDDAIVVDTMNYWSPIDGTIDDVEADPRSSSEIVADRNPRARWVKALNHLGYHDMEADTRPAGTPGRRAVAAASDDEEAKRVVLDFVDSLGFDPVDAGSLADGRSLQTGEPVFGQELDRARFEELLGESSRSAVVG
jgi:predicted dinucleotide-binding enzyme